MKAMRKCLLLALAALIWGSLGSTALAQTSKAEVVKQIRKKYAEAKKDIADNGKNGQAPLDITIRIDDGTEVSEDFIINDITDLTFYFKRPQVDGGLYSADGASCYFIIRNWSAYGHSNYREMLFDGKGRLLFSFIRSETHAGVVTESRYYYGANEKPVEHLHKIGGKETTDETLTGTGADTELAMAHKYQEIFDALMKPSSKAVAANQAKKTTATPKADRMSFIRSQYAEAKEKQTKNEKSELPLDVHVVIRDQTMGPPETLELNYYFDQVTDQVEPDAVSVDNYCYFISEHHHNNRMGFDNYSEFLFAQKSHDLIFSYTCAREEGEKNEWRYYYDENGKCIEVKTDAAENDKGTADKETAGRYLDIFKKLFETE